MPNDNPILNNPYVAPRWHYATNLDGELDYEVKVEGRRPWAGSTQSIPVARNAQRHLIDHDTAAAASYGDHMVNVLRREVKAWRDGGYSDTMRVTRELLHFWFKNDQRPNELRLFFAQQEAVETAIFLNEVAEKSNVGQRILRDLEEAQSVTGNLPRVCFKMATGTGKTVVMGALIVYHFFNRLEYRGDVRFADNFLLVAPGVTIRDRLGALRVDPRAGPDATDDYHARFLVPTSWRREMGQLNARIVIVNYHALQPRTLQGNKRSPFDGKIGPDGKKAEAKEDAAQVIRRLLGKLRGERLLIINDEAHHCYLPKSDDRKAEGEDAAKENERAAVWFNGLREVTQRYKVRSVYDLSATPYYLTGSGHDPYTLFEWVVSDFGLIEAIESGLVKIPFLPESDDTNAIALPVLRDLYHNIPKNELPRAGRRKQRARAKEAGEPLKEEPPKIPEVVKAAFGQFYEHYEEEFKHRRHSTAASAGAQMRIDDTPPVFIVVCNNTSVSKEVYKYIAGYEQADAADGEPPAAVPGVFDLFSNYDPGTLQAKSKPPTLLIDSDALENSEQIDDGFRRVFAREIDRFKRAYTVTHGQGAAELITEAELLREVVNTVGKPGALGSHVRCVVSVSMLTEGWDANTVTHIAGLRAFGSQLLCEQVAGRALRRKRYLLEPYDPESGELLTEKQAKLRKAENVLWKFPPEYAHIIGVPFKLFKGGKNRPIERPPAKPIYAMPERTEKYELHFPNVEGYRVDYPTGPLHYSFTGLEDYQVDGSKLPTRTVMGTGVDGTKVELSVESLLETRDQHIVYRIAKDLLRDHFADADGNPQFDRFHQLTAVVEDWYAKKVRVLHKDAKWKKLLYYTDSKKLVAHVVRAIQTGDNLQQRIRPVLHHYNPEGSSGFVHGQTVRETYPTRHSHVNLVVIDSGWEGNVAKVLDDLAEEGHVSAWLKNAFLDFRIPYIDAAGESRDYVPDFIVLAKTAAGEMIYLLLEVTGMTRDKTQKRWTVENRWLPAVNGVREKHDWPRWDFLEIREDVRDARNDILKKLSKHEG